MTYALVENDRIVQIGPLPRLWWADTRWHWFDAPNENSSPSNYGWLEVVETARPADTETTTSDYSIQLVDGVPTGLWSLRELSPEEQSNRKRAASAKILTDPQVLRARLGRLAAYKTDSDILAALARTNNTVIQTSDLNKLLKTMIRRQARQDAAIALLVRLLKEELLTDIQDTIDIG